MPGGSEPVADSRAEILRRIRAAVRPSPVPIPRDYDRSRVFDSVLDLFADRVADYRAIVHRVSDVPAFIDSTLSGKRIVAPTDVPAEWLVP